MCFNVENLTLSLVFSLFIKIIYDFWSSKSLKKPTQNQSNSLVNVNSSVKSSSAKNSLLMCKYGPEFARKKIITITLLTLKIKKLINLLVIGGQTKCWFDFRRGTPCITNDVHNSTKFFAISVSFAFKLAAFDGYGNK